MARLLVVGSLMYRFVHYAYQQQRTRAILVNFLKNLGIIPNLK